MTESPTALTVGVLVDVPVAAALPLALAAVRCAPVRLSRLVVRAADAAPPRAAADCATAFWAILSAPEAACEASTRSLLVER
jgi:hypothetical protein